MALGGGTWLTQNKILPGSYINFVSVARASVTLSDRGIATIPIILDWGIQGTVMEIDAANFQKNSLYIFGYDYTDPKLKPLRELFRNVRLAYIYRLGDGGVKASNTYATAVFAGERGNALKVVVTTNVDDNNKFDVILLLNGAQVDKQTVETAEELVNNDFVTWGTEELVLTPTAGTPLTGGASPTITNANYQSYIDAIEAYSYNAIGCPSDNSAVIGLFAAFTRRMRDERGVKFQCVTYNPVNNSDFEGVVDVMNAVTDAGADAWSAIYWVTGVIAGTAVNRSATNRQYDGEYSIDVSHTQTQLEDAILGGKFAFHRVGSNIRVLADINSLVNLTTEKGEVFQENQTIRVIDQIANDIAVLFNGKYLGEVPNDPDGRVSLWSDITGHHLQLQFPLRAIENFNPEDVTVEPGATKRAVLVHDKVTPVNAMTQLYMTVMVA